MKAFLDDDFLLTTPTARRLYQVARSMPILDYHCHLDPKEIAQDRRFENITQVWLGGDHYKWRLMRANGVDEAYITGDAPDREKFQKWAETLELAIGNPLYHWSHLELRRYFGYEGVLNEDTAQEVWELCNQKLQEPGMSARNLIANSGVTLVCTTDDPADSLEWHQQLAQDSSFPVKVLPAWRPDAAMGLERPEYLDYLQRLGQAAGVEIRTYGDLKKALLSRMAFFDKMGCRASDHALTVAVCQPASEEELERVFQKRLEGEPLTQEELAAFQTGFLRFVAGEYKRLGWVMQLHYGCRRNNNTRMFHKLGRDTGYDAVLQGTPSLEVAAFLDLLASQDALPRMVLYSLNPNDDEGLNSVIGCFQDGTPLGRIQQGSAWWFNDHKAGMVKQLTAFANGGLLGNFIGMLTDSRSFLSYPRHEYFRRILCELLGAWVENGEYPADWKSLEKMVRGVCYNNAVEFFGFPLEKA
ncbi:MAG TPA: glucuronate isomerase [Candidatus Acutalibacter ornithocaccae]|uniref:Uronate isomerase n=1 Tax=Candidatus Acutalibacter ornithocaccae TaxID=2838416 RepID=A0A9D2M027_9FIRM|nr:glucuronate isomerase [Candidatus Acutalibacter ornithocaccae]